MGAPCDLEVEFYILDAEERNRVTAFRLTRRTFVWRETRKTRTEAALFFAATFATKEKQCAIKCV